MRSRISLISLLVKQRADPAQMLVNLALRKYLADCDSVLDVGSGKSLTLRHLQVSKTTGFDGYAPDLEQAKQMNTHDEYVLGDVRELDKNFKPGQFDGVIALDVIEHLPKEDGWKMMAAMENVARKKVIFFTPCGFLPQRNYQDADLQAHFSGWEPAEMREHGYYVAGMLGLKSLRGEFHLLKGKPRAFWGIVSMLTHLFWTRWTPEKAAAILCVKDKQDK